jgi:hypothetical protein
MNSPSFSWGGIAKSAMRSALFVVPLIVAAGPLEAGSYAGERTSEAGPTIVRTVWQSGGELVTQLMNCTSNAYVPVLTVTIPTVSAGQTLSIDGDMEATNPYTTLNPMLATYLTVNGKPVDNAEAFNITPNQHHMTVTRAAFWQAKSNMKNVVVQLVARACDDGLTSNQVALQVDYGYGTVFVKVS